MLVEAKIEGIKESLLALYQETVRRFLDVSEQPFLIISPNSILSRNIRFRETYLLPLHVLQIEFLKRYRLHPQENMLDMILITVKGIAAGMKNTG